jgi:hypothetical protein
MESDLLRPSSGAGAPVGMFEMLYVIPDFLRVHCFNINPFFPKKIN